MTPPHSPFRGIVQTILSTINNIVQTIERFFKRLKKLSIFSNIRPTFEDKNGILEQNNLQWPPLPFRGIVQTILSTIKRRLVGTQYKL